MREPAATLEQNPADEISSEPLYRGGGAMKFVYASGSRPLDGFTIKRGVGIGGFGEVYFATSDAGKEVALKRIQRNLDIELRGVRQCLNLKHGNLIALYDIKYDDDGGAWVVMEYIAGESLKDVIERHPGGMPMDEVKLWFEGIAAGVAYLHDHGIVHRDLKPGNIFSDDRMVKIGDYGLSKFISCSRRDNQTESVGTFHYMAPEIGKGVYGKEIDVYALGIILYEMLTGQVPFEGESSQEIIMKHLTADPDLTGIEQPYRSVIERSLYKDPDKRFSSVEEMLRRLPFGSSGTRDEPSDELPELQPEDSPLVDAEPVIPPIVRPPHAYDNDGTLYITEDEPQDIVFGPVKERPGATPPVRPTGAPNGATTNRRRTTSHREEPIARAVKTGYHRAANWWQHSRMGTPLKVLLLIGAIALLVLNSEWLIPVSIVAGACYLVYLGIRALVIAAKGGGSPVDSPAADPVRSVAYRRREHRAAWNSEAREILRHRTQSERVTELTGSLLGSAVVCSVLSLLASSPGLNFHSVDAWTLVAWLALTGTAGCWTILTINKFWEGSTSEEQVSRRFVMLVGGLVVGTVAFLSNQALLVEMQNVPEMSLPTLSVATPAGAYANDGTPQLPAYLIYFGGLFLILRWWRQADPVRRTRFSLWATGCCVLWAWILNIFWQFPQPWGFMLAAVISIGVQISAPWMNPRALASASPRRETVQEI